MPSKKFQEVCQLIDKNRVYPIDEAIDLLKKCARTKFDESAELHVKLGIDPEKSDQQVRGTISLPHGSGKTKKVAAFVDPDKEEEARSAGADIVANEEMINEMAQKGSIDFDVAVATPTMMPKIAKLAKILGPRGLMPNPKTDTVGPNVSKMIEEQKAGKISFKNDAGANLHIPFGKASFDEQKLKENLLALIETVKKQKPSSSKGIFVKNMNICTTMGPGIKIDSN